MDPRDSSCSERATREDPLVRWLLREGGHARSLVDFVDNFIPQLRAEGVAVDRFSLNLRLLHPLFAACSLWWTPERGTVRNNWLRALEGGEAFQSSPIAKIYSERAPIRRRLVGAALESVEFPVLREFQARGGTDYLAMPLVGSDGSVWAISYVTNAPGGFDDDALARLDQLAPALALVVELWSHRELSATLLETYVGRTTGRRVLEGSIARGDRERLRAVVWYCDLRGYTRLSEANSPDLVLTLLDHYFEAVVGPVREHDGEVLKFMGDGMLAIFPIAPAGDEDGELHERAVCRAALTAARAAVARVAALEPPPGLQERVRFGLALHVGEVVYGNIGAAERLDFTVIGRAVNEASRVEGMCKPLGQSLLVTRAFAAHCPDGLLRSLGEHTLRGVAAPQELLTLAE